jgi:hypothetical protein
MPSQGKQGNAAMEGLANRQRPIVPTEPGVPSVDVGCTENGSAATANPSLQRTRPWLWQPPWPSSFFPSRSRLHSMGPGR